jgi:hypothetical protein
VSTFAISVVWQREQELQPCPLQPRLQLRWSRRVREFVQIRKGRRRLAETRPAIEKGPGWGPSTWLRSFVFDPFDPEWNCGSKRKIGIAV